jgi:hypothetical protein
MQLKRVLGSVTAAIALTAAGVLYAAHPAKSSDHQDTYNLANSVGHNTSADITDVFVYQAPDNPNNVVFAMDVSPLIPAGMGGSFYFDPSLMWQFKISHQTSGAEDEVIQLGATGTGVGQTITLYGPGKPAQVGTTNTFIGQTGSFGIGTSAEGSFSAGTIKAFAGPRADPFVFDLFAFFTFLGDRNVGTHMSQTDPGPETNGPIYNGDNAGAAAQLAPAYDKSALPTQASFNGFPAGQMSTTSGGNGGALGSYACSTNAASGTLTNFNVLTYVVEVPKSLLTTASLNSAGSTSSTIHVWATVSSSTTNS